MQYESQKKNIFSYFNISDVLYPCSSLLLPKQIGCLWNKNSTTKGEDYYSDALSDKNRFEDLYDSVQEDNKYLIAQLEELQKWRSLGVFRITAYWFGEDEYGDLTSTGVKAQVNHTIAVDPEIIPYGSKVMIDGQIYVAEDCGGAIKNNVIDVWVENQSNSFGVKYTEIYIKREK